MLRMQLYGGKHFLGYEPVYQLSSVDVLTESGLFQHGEVIDVAENGLIVDFHCSEQRAQFVSYDNIFDASVAHCTSEYSSWRDELHSSPAVRENASVQALCRAHPGAPWLWYPGRLRSTVLNPLQSGLMVVEIQINGRLVMEVLPPCQVRFPPNQKDLSRRALHPNHFVARECRVPENYGSTVTPAIDAGFRHSFSEAQRAHIVPVLDRNCEKLKYVQRSDGRPLTEDEV
ncbi:uncharacterized protein LOC129599723, partial [Paramacrobiotus metropolitanus]|uniref:uncharacterized protein LOC129599723 n=1 Tax=Paramacrobiotus metropolitanus TaxID=2943436 RepID=UPI002445BFC1